MEFGDKIKDLPTNEQTPETNEKQLLINILKPAPPSKLSSFTHVVRLVSIALIVYFLTKTALAKNFISKYITNETTYKYCSYALVLVSVYLYHIYS
jgi:hypothetical protein